MKFYGSIAGNPSLGSKVQITNKFRFSYPGYAELLTGQARDDIIKSNDNIQNPFQTVLEFVKHEKNLTKEQVAAIASWETIRFIAEQKVGNITANSGKMEYTLEGEDSVLKMINQLQFEALPPWDSMRHDCFTHQLAMVRGKIDASKRYISFI
jgi:hypothetical protein